VDDADVGCSHDLATRAKGDPMHSGDDGHRQFAPAPGGVLGVIGNAVRAVGQRTASAAATSAVGGTLMK
jgi:hypothetical protein